MRRNKKHIIFYLSSLLFLVMPPCIASEKIATEEPIPEEIQKAPKLFSVQDNLFSHILTAEPVEYWIPGNNSWTIEESPNHDGLYVWTKPNSSVVNLSVYTKSYLYTVYLKREPDPDGNHIASIEVEPVKNPRKIFEEKPSSIQDLLAAAKLENDNLKKRMTLQQAQEAENKKPFNIPKIFKQPTRVKEEDISKLSHLEEKTNVGHIDYNKKVNPTIKRKKRALNKNTIAAIFPSGFDKRFNEKVGTRSKTEALNYLTIEYGIHIFGSGDKLKEPLANQTFAEWLKGKKFLPNAKPPTLILGD